MNKLRIKLTALLGFTAVAAGAFGAHSFKSYLSPEMLEVYKTGVLYHLIHSSALLFLSLNEKYKFKYSFILMFTGTILFSFSLYIYALIQIIFFAFITPIGGVLMLAGWLLIFFEAGKK